MGYTHRWHVHDLTRDLKTAEIADDVLRLMMASEIPVCRNEDEGNQPPRLAGDGIEFNGTGEDAAEAFWYPPTDPDHLKRGLPPGKDWCKTYRRPYDAIVAAALISIKHHLGDNVTTRSDGRLEEEEWQTALRLYRRTFPERSLPRAFVREYGAESPQLPLIPVA